MCGHLQLKRTLVGSIESIIGAFVPASSTGQDKWSLVVAICVRCRIGRDDNHACLGSEVFTSLLFKSLAHRFKNGKIITSTSSI
jgi:hypothetical protein